MFLALIIFVVCMFQVVPKLLEYKQSDDVYQEIQDEGIEESTESNQSSILTIDWDAYADTEIIAWFQMDNISYPIVQHSDNSYYLHRLPNGKRNSGGSLFLLSQNSPFLTDRNSFIYGHNMRDGSMFGQLKNYVTSQSKDHLFYIYLPDGTRHTYQFFSENIVNQNSKAYTWFFESDDAFMDWQQWMLSCSKIGTSLSASESAKYVTLSTCYGKAGTSKRLLICGQEIAVDSLQEPASWYDDYLQDYLDKTAIVVD